MRRDPPRLQGLVEPPHSKRKANDKGQCCNTTKVPPAFAQELPRPALPRSLYRQSGLRKLRRMG
eukprot:15470645-Alexandrium_andersonii.AAC.1